MLMMSSETAALSGSPSPDALSDDSGVDLKAPRRNKRKSSEPKRRKEVLLMGRFRWEDTDEEEEEEEEEDGSSQETKRPKKETEEEAPSRQSVIRREEAGAQEEEEESRRGRPRNYKGMSRQRRIEANARERTRVHTISAAFESLRRAVPAYAHNQKLSKLAILRIASAYIVALACLSGGDGGEKAVPDCVDRCTRTIQAEGRSRRRTSKD